MKNKFIFLIIIALLLCLLLADIAYGTVAIPLTEVVNILAGNAPQKASWATIVFEFRLPKTITAVLAGAGLAVSGLQMQTLFRNSLAGPDVLGISSGASLGVALMVLAHRELSGIPGFSGSAWSVTLAAVAGAAMVMTTVLSIAVRMQSSTALLIVGLMLSSTMAALVGILQYFSRAEELQAYLVWTFGSLSGTGWDKLPVLVAATATGVVISLLNHKALNALLLGENYAASMGVPVARLRFLVIAATSLLAGSITAFCGPIGFAGIAVPHLTRLIFGSSNHRVLLPGACLCGAVFMLGCDLLCQLPGQAQVLPINIVTSLFGAPVVIWMVAGRKKL